MIWLPGGLVSATCKSLGLPVTRGTGEILMSPWQNIPKSGYKVAVRLLHLKVRYQDLKCKWMQFYVNLLESDYIHSVTFCGISLSCLLITCNTFVIVYTCYHCVSSHTEYRNAWQLNANNFDGIIFPKNKLRLTRQKMLLVKDHIYLNLSTVYVGVLNLFPPVACIKTLQILVYTLFGPFKLTVAPRPVLYSTCISTLFSQFYYLYYWVLFYGLL